MLRVGSGTPPRFSSLSESGFIPTIIKLIHGVFDRLGSHLFQRVASFLHDLHRYEYRPPVSQRSSHLFQRVASFLHPEAQAEFRELFSSSHLFQRVASFLPAVCLFIFLIFLFLFSSLSESGFIPTPAQGSSFQNIASMFSSLSESGFIPTKICTKPFGGGEC